MDIEQPHELLEYLRQRGHLAATEAVDIERLAGGVSNRTMLVRREHKPDWVVKQALPKLRVEVDWFCDPARIHREAAGLRALQRILPSGQVPEFVFEDEDFHLFGMTAVPEPHDNWKTLLLAGKIDETLVEQSARMLAAIHAHAGQETTGLSREFEDRSFFEALRLEPYYGFSSEQVPVVKPFLNRLLEETRSRQQTLVHGDYSPKNILVYRDRLILLDHEVIHWGDPSFDCGFFLAHLLSKAHYVSGQRGPFLSAAKLWMERYLAQTAHQPWADDLEARIVRQTLGCLLARVRGRSQLEYLSEDGRTRQANAVVELMCDSCDTFDTLCRRFSELTG
jgi:aminoglycoside phosphotransferase (APT) family kinase protein